MVSAVLLVLDCVRWAVAGSRTASSSALPAMTTWMNSDPRGLAGKSAFRAVPGAAPGRDAGRGPTLSKCSACSMSCVAIDCQAYAPGSLNAQQALPGMILLGSI